MHGFVPVTGFPACSYLTHHIHSLQVASGDATYICNSAFAAKEQLHTSHSTFPCITQAHDEATSLDRGKRLLLQGLPAESLHKAKQAWQKLLVERLQYLQ